MAPATSAVAGRTRRGPGLRIVRRRARVIVGAVRLVHPFPVATVVVTSLVLLIVAHRGNPGLGLVLRAGLAVLLSQIAVGALNDYHDRHLDLIAQPDKPIPSGQVPAAVAAGMVVVSLILLVPVALSFGAGGALLVAVGTGAGLAYDLWLKPTAWSWLGYFAGFLSLLTWIWLVAGHIGPSFFLLYPGGVLLVFAAHLAQSFPDVETDARTSQLGLAARLGHRRTFTVIITCLTAASAALIALSIVRVSVAGGLLGVIALGLSIMITRLQRRAFAEREARVLVFHLVAPTVALTALGGVLAIAA